MATFPAVKFSWRDMAEAPDSVVVRSEMERGMPKQRRINSDVRVQVPLTLYFDSVAEADAFEAWFYNDINAGQDFFNWTPPRRSTPVQARIVGGKLGELKFSSQDLQASSRTVVLEYVRSAW